MRHGCHNLNIRASITAQSGCSHPFSPTNHGGHPSSTSRQSSVYPHFCLMQSIKPSCCSAISFRKAKALSAHCSVKLTYQPDHDISKLFVKPHREVLSRTDQTCDCPQNIRKKFSLTDQTPPEINDMLTQTVFQRFQMRQCATRGPRDGKYFPQL